LKGVPDDLLRHLNSALGRALRILLGIALIVYGLFAVGGTIGMVVAVIGLAPIGLGLWGRCLLEPFVPPAHPV
jgi:hypothetical protein